MKISSELIVVICVVTMVALIAFGILTYQNYRIKRLENREVKIQPKPDDV